MTDTPAAMQDDALVRVFLLQKQGLYYRPGNSGYTGIKENAGRYLESEARPDCGVTAIHQDRAPDFSPSCWDDLAREHLEIKVAALRAENDALQAMIGENDLIPEGRHAALLVENEALRAADDDMIATLAAIRGTATTDEWAGSAKHFHDQIGEVMGRRRALSGASHEPG